MSSRFDHDSGPMITTVPMVLGVIRWSRSIGMPQKPITEAFAFQVQERKAARPFAEGGGTNPNWGALVDLDCATRFSDASDETGPAVRFSIIGTGYSEVHGRGLPDLDGYHVVTPSIVGRWRRSIVIAAGSVKRFDPQAAMVQLTRSAPHANVDFEIVVRGAFG